MSRCTTTLPGVALHPFYDRGSVGIPGFTPTPFETRVQDCADLCSARTECVGWSHRHGGRGPTARRCWLGLNLAA